MNNPVLNEALSALIDGELDPKSERELLEQIAADDRLSKKFEHYQLIAQVIQSTVSPKCKVKQHTKPILGASEFNIKPNKSK